MKHLNIYELHEEINKKKKKRSQSFDHVLGTCHQKIKNASKKELVKVFFDVPEFVIGLPVYNLTDCIKHLMKSLEENGFLVQYFFPKLLYISWDFDEIKANDRAKTDLQIPYVGKPKAQIPYVENDNANKLIMKPSALSATKQVEHRPNGKFILNID